MNDKQAEQNFLALQNKSYEIKFELNDTNYKPIENIGTGAYGVVCSALHTLTSKKVAIKKIPDIFEQQTIAKRTYREIKILKHLKHDNIIAIREILKPKGPIENLRDVYIVLDLMETDLHRIIHSKQELTDEHVRYFLYQILRGLKYIHSANIIHRDLKPSNLLVNENCDLKIGDFGMARAVSSNPDEHNLLMTQYVATRWYRAPELMMARLAYTGAVDMWSVGCIFAEMLGRKQIFPGRDFIHQLKLIIGVLGTPSKDFMKLTQSDTIKKFLTGWGNKKPVPLKQLYPRAQPAALELLNKMLQINPQSRLSVGNALSDTFMSKYHDPLDEPICVPAFDFDFEKKEVTSVAVKEAIIHEIMEYHQVKHKSKIMFDFRPVPRDQIHTKPSKPLEATSSKIDSAKTEESNFGLDAFLSKLRGQSNNSNVNKSADLAAFLAEHSSKSNDNSKNRSTNQAPSFLSTISPTNNETGFKVPVGLPLAKMKNLKVSPEAASGSQTDVEMLSAKSEQGGGSNLSQLSVTTAGSSATGSDVEMLSANKIKSSGVSAEVATIGDEKAVNTKEVLKAAILSAALRKQKGEFVAKPRPMTALQRQREREDKKRKKIEKAMERKKKQKQKQKSSGSINLSDEDKNLLERWANMQNVTKISDNNPATPAPNVPNPGISAAIPAQNSLNQPINTVIYPPFVQSVEQSTILQKPVNNINIIQSSSQVISQTLMSTQVVSQRQETVVNPTIQTYHQITNPLPVHNHITTGITTPQHITTDITTHKQVQQHITTSSSNPLPVHHNIPTGVTRLATEVEQSLSPLTNPLDSILDVLEKDSPVQLSQQSTKLPPTYSEAVTAKMHGNISPEQQTGLSFVDPTDGRIDNGNIQSSTTVSSTNIPDNTFLPFHSYQNDLHNRSATSSMYSSNLPLIGGQNDEVLPTIGGSNNAGQSDGQMLSVITRQMMKSHVDDLTLTKTPKGTGGGYGVGLDMEAVMSEAGREMVQPDRSAPLSATESLIGDWLEVSGMKGLDAKDYEALERELGLGSPINLSDIVTSPS